MNEEIQEALENAKEELKRVDHLIYVSLKYTRTCDIFKSIIDRLVNVVDFLFDAMLLDLVEKETIEEVPPQAGIKCKLIRQHIEDEEISKIIDVYLLWRQMNRADFERAREYRRHVTMTMHINDEKYEITIDNITEYYKDAKSYFERVFRLLVEEQ